MDNMNDDFDYSSENMKIDVWFPDEHRKSPKDWALPDPLVKYIDKYWVAKKKGPLLALVLEDQSAEKWARLGNALTKDVITTAPQFGVGLWSKGGPYEGLISAILGWTVRIMHSRVQGALNLAWSMRAHPMANLMDVQMPDVEDIVWCAYLSKHDEPWLATLWGSIESDVLHVDVHLMLTAYDLYPQYQALAHEGMQSIQDFGKSIEHATGWIIPLDSNIGFILGVSSRSVLYQKLRPRDLQ